MGSRSERYEHDLDEAESPASGLPRGVAGRPQTAPRRREGDDARARRPQYKAPRASDGEDRKALRLQGTPRRGEPARIVRGAQPAHGWSLHVRPRLGRWVLELLGRRRRDVRGPAQTPP